MLHVCEGNVNETHFARSAEAGGAGVTGVLLEPCHAEFPDSTTTRWLLSIKNTGGAFFVLFCFYCFQIKEVTEDKKTDL